MEGDPHAFMTLPSKSAVTVKVSQFINRVHLQSQFSDCVVCSQEVQTSHTETFTLNDIPNLFCLHPINAHGDQDLYRGALVHSPSVVWDRDGVFASVCRRCLGHLKHGLSPPDSLAAGHWTGSPPLPLINLTLVEKVLVARQPAAVYVISREAELTPRSNNDFHQVLQAPASQTMPMPTDELASFFKLADAKSTLRTAPQCFRVRRAKIEEALIWLKDNNPFYNDIVISRDRLEALPCDGVPKLLNQHVTGNGLTPKSVSHREHFFSHILPRQIFKDL